MRKLARGIAKLLISYWLAAWTVWTIKVTFASPFWRGVGYFVGIFAVVISTDIIWIVLHGVWRAFTDPRSTDFTAESAADDENPYRPPGRMIR